MVPAALAASGVPDRDPKPFGAPDAATAVDLDASFESDFEGDSDPDSSFESAPEPAEEPRVPDTAPILQSVLEHPHVAEPLTSFCRTVVRAHRQGVRPGAPGAATPEVLITLQTVGGVLADLSDTRLLLALYGPSAPLLEGSMQARQNVRAEMSRRVWQGIVEAVTARLAACARVAGLQAADLVPFLRYLPVPAVPRAAVAVDAPAPGPGALPPVPDNKGE